MSIYKKLPDNITASDISRFWSYVDRRGADECWNWKASQFTGGYGQFKINSQTIRSNRFAYFLQHGIDPLEKLVCHTCDNTSCCNGAHLFLGSSSENMLDAVAKGRANTASGERHGSRTKPENWARGEQVYGAVLTAEKVAEIQTLYLTGKFTQESLADKFCVNRQTIGKILRGENWKHISIDTEAIAEIATHNHAMNGEKNPQSKLTIDQVQEIRDKNKQGISYSKLANIYGVHKATIANIVTFKNWK